MRTGEHVALTGVSTFCAVLLGVPLGIVADRHAPIRSQLLGCIGILQTVPSLAMLAILLAMTGRIGFLPAIIALTLYALLPIVRNTVTGLQGVSPSVMEAARGMGMTSFQRMWKVQLPLAVPVIVAGIRTAAVVGVGIATLSAFIGAGGLGQFINRGLALSSTNLILLGALPAAVLALMVDLSLGAAQWGVQPMPQKMRGTLKAKLRPLATALPAIVLVGSLLPSVLSRGAASDVRIGSKNFSEQFILGHLVAELIESRTDLTVDRRFNLGGTDICHEALANGEIDLYVEYTGTGLVNVLGLDPPSNGADVLAVLDEAYQEQFDATWLSPLGYNSTYAVTVRKADALQHGWTRISDLASHAANLKAGFTAEFSERKDGYPGMRDLYGLAFGEVVDLDPNLMYQAIAKGEVDVISAFARHGKIQEYDLQPLEDDRGFWPRYDAAVVVRQQILETYPELRDTLALLGGLLNDQTMTALNYQVDVEGRSPRSVASQFLVKKGLTMDGS